MRDILTVKTIRELDGHAVSNLHIQHITLMENAGEAVFNYIIKMKEQLKAVLVVCGVGNNGGDGYVVARKLYEAGINIKILQVGEPNTASAKENFTRCAKLDICVSKDLTIPEGEYSLIIDCIFGTGISKPVTGDCMRVINGINTSNAYVVSVDIPSGLDATNGSVLGVAVRADITLTLVAEKIGLLLNNGLDYCGKIVSLNIGVPKFKTDGIYCLEANDVKQFFPKRSRNTHKGSFGKVTIIGGSDEYFGAGVIAENALSALSVGAGYGTLAVPRSLIKYYIGRNLQSTIFPLRSLGRKLAFDKKGLGIIIKGSKVIGIGMGIGLCRGAKRTVQFLLRNYSGTLIIDADGLNALAKIGMNEVAKAKCKVVLTPHILEFCRISGYSKSEVQENAVYIACEFAKKFNVILALKSASTIITDGEETYINTSGTPAMAKAGTGDVLSGVISGIIAFNNASAKAVASACYLLGEAGERCADNLAEYCVLSSDIVKQLKDILN